MQFSKLRLVGFKSFVEATEFEIQPGLTGIIGPNGCGKSNLVEALRWVMGENSYRSMRASGMDDVIFAGASDRPARNMAEVGLTLDNSARTAPAAFNDAEVLEITRRIEREQGSTYRINGREVRARDVQILFADASSGSRSPALVRQGQIAEIIAAKPQARRRVLEDAAGVGGLHTRRHEAELRLKGAEDNLARIDDVLTQITAQAEGLKRQARQAQRFKDLQAEIRRTHALAALIDIEDAGRDVAGAAATLAAATSAVTECTRAQAEAARAQAIAAYSLPDLRAREADCGAALQNVVMSRQMLDGEERRAKGRQTDLERRIKEMSDDLARDAAVLDDSGDTLRRLDAEEADLDSRESPEGMDAALHERVADAQTRRAAADAALAAAQTMLSDAEARRRALEERVREDADRLARCERDLARTTAERGHLGAGREDGAFDVAMERLRFAATAAEGADLATRDAESAAQAARAAEAASRTPLAEADRAMQRLDTEVTTLTKLLEAASGAPWPPITDEIAVASGYEAALGAALGDDLDAASDSRAPAHWAELDGAGDPALPAGVTALSAHVEGPPGLRRRLAQIGLVDRAAGAALRAGLAPGQRLVSREGDLWRWDGFTQAAESPTPAARRLAERNRLAGVRRDAEAARAAYQVCRTAGEAVQSELRETTARDIAARTKAQEARRTLDAARETHAALERERSDAATKLAALDAAAATARAARDEAAERKTASDAALTALPPSASLAPRVEAARKDAETLRAIEADARAAQQASARERDARTRRLAAIAADRGAWKARADQAEAHRADLTGRLEAANGELRQLGNAPDHFIHARRQILSDIDAAETALRAASDARAVAETALSEADRNARVSLEAMAAAREDKARSEARAEASAQRLEAITRAIATDLECEPTALPALAGVKADAPRPPGSTVAAKLDALRTDRDRLGAVNLRADEELTEMEAQRSGLDKEKVDLAEAIRRLRQAIGSLNKEGRERLLHAFETVNGHFKELFTVLFGGGTAELQLVESDDPLEAGLEIIARPPGKKPQVMTLLSGGEQALTAISLIFAIFLTNPSPICVLDEVDAPLDDANVERFCDLVDSMRSKTQTRFIAITHNPITMARMDRLYGVTQAERGISQLVSVDLSEAEQMLEAS